MPMNLLPYLTRRIIYIDSVINRLNNARTIREQDPTLRQYGLAEWNARKEEITALIALIHRAEFNGTPITLDDIE